MSRDHRPSLLAEPVAVALPPLLPPLPVVPLPLAAPPPAEPPPVPPLGETFPLWLPPPLELLVPLPLELPLPLLVPVVVSSPAEVDPDVVVEVPGVPLPAPSPLFLSSHAASAALARITIRRF